MRSFVVAAALAVVGAAGFADRADAQVFFNRYPGGLSLSIGGYGYYPGLYGYSGYPSYYSGYYSRPYYGGYRGGWGYRPYYGGSRYGGYRYGGYRYGGYRGWRGRWR
jgi:hypothetical protein